jgi:hypothetical protein
MKTENTASRATRHSGIKPTGFQDEKNKLAGYTVLTDLKQ